jgi:spore maturation protein CgeB
VRPALVAAVNYTVGLAELCEEAQVPLLCWEVDPELRTMTRVAGSTARAFVFTYRRRHIGEFRSAGFRHVEELPLAANPARRKPETLSEGELARYAAPVSYVGSSMVPEAGGFEARFVQSYCAWRGGAAQAQAEGRALLESLLAAQRADLSRDLIADELRRRCPGWPELALAARFASEVASAQKRVTYVSALGRFGMQVWGDPGWKATEGTGVVYRGAAEHGQELNRIYCASRINIDIGRLYQQDIVTMRIFDILACGGFVLAERSDDLGALFALDREIACYSTRDELVEKVGYYLAHEDEARAIARAGQAAVLARHTVGQRISLMLERLGLPG